MDDGRIETIRGDAEDPFSRGHICPKAYGLKSLEEDPDRLRTPVRRTASGFEPISWEEAFSIANAGLARVRAAHGNNGVGVYLGNPNAHSLHAMLYAPVLLKALGTRQVYSASSADQLPKMLSAGLMFGAGLSIPVPDLDRTDYLLVLGANPVVSNGSLMTAPDVERRLRDIQRRGGKVVVIDPRRTETARLADAHHFIRPGTDAALLLALCNVIVADGAVELGAVADHVRGLEQVIELVAAYAPERVASWCGIEAEAIRSIARELCAAPSAACYGRIGTTCQEFGTVASWAVDLVNILSGNLDREGGAMFARPAAVRGANRSSEARGGRGVKLGRWSSRVAGRPEMMGELPVAILADEILEPGDGQIRAMITIAGNPLVSAPNVGKLTRAFDDLDFMVAVDFYINETTRFADVILPPPSPLQRDTYDLSLYNLAIRNVAKYSAPATKKPDEHVDEWEILLTLAKAAMGMGAVSLEQADEFVARQLAERELRGPGRWDGLNAEEALGALSHRAGPARLLDFMLRVGPYGDGFGRVADGLTLSRLEATPHGIDLGALTPGIPALLRTPDALIDLAPQLIVDDLPRLDTALDRAPTPLVLIGRRHLRSNNSWAHNWAPLIKGKDRCTLQISPRDAQPLGIATGSLVRVASRVGEIELLAEVTDHMMPGVVSVPHGFGHDAAGVRMAVAREHAGANVNLLSDDLALDTVSGNAAFNGVPVTVSLRGSPHASPRVPQMR